MIGQDMVLCPQDFHSLLGILLQLPDKRGKKSSSKTTTHDNTEHFDDLLSKCFHIIHKIRMEYKMYKVKHMYYLIDTDGEK